MNSTAASLQNIRRVSNDRNNVKRRSKKVAVANDEIHRVPVYVSNSLERAKAKRKEKREKASANDDELTAADLSARNLGTEISPICTIQRLLGENLITQQTAMIANKLESRGIQTRRNDGITQIGELTGTVIQSRYRNINILPEIMTSKRHVWLNDFKYWMSRHTRGHYMRYMVITSGETVPVGLPALARYDDFSRKIGSFVTDAARHFNIEIPLVSIEYTLSRSPLTGQLLMNLHANVVYMPPYMKGFDVWLAFCRRRFGGTILRDCGRLEDTNEVIKYVMKPAEMVLATAEETAALHYMTTGRQFLRAYGEFQLFRRNLKEAGRKVSRDDKSGRLVVHRKKSREQDIADGIRRDMEQRERPMLTDAVQDARQERQERLQAAGINNSAENEVVYVTLPQARRSSIKERFIGVRNFTMDPTTDAGKFGIRRIRSIRADSVNRLRMKGFGDERIEASTYKLDTGTLIPAAVDQLSSIKPPQQRKILESIGLDPKDYDADNLSDEQKQIITEAMARKVDPIWNRFDRVDLGDVSDIAEFDPDDLAKRVVEIQTLRGPDHRDARRRAYVALPEPVPGW